MSTIRASDESENASHAVVKPLVAPRPGLLRRRWMLAALIATGHLVVLPLALLIFVGWLRTDVTDLITQQSLATNRQVAANVVRVMQEIGLADLTFGSPDWERLQKLIESIRLPNDGYICVVSDRDGRMLCHTNLRSTPEPREMRPGLLTLHGRDQSGRIIDLVGAARSDPSMSPTGWVDTPNGRHLVAAHAAPGLGAVVLVHQNSDAVAAAVELIAGRVRTIGITVAVLLAIASAIVTMLIMQRYEGRLQTINRDLEEEVRHRTRSLMKTRDAVIFGITKLADARDDETGQHLERIGKYCVALATQLAKTDASIDRDFIDTLAFASALHDIGKVGIPDAVLRKPGRLTTDERQIIKKHPGIGGDTLMAIKQRLGEDDFLEMACEIAYAHHERWDGKGYPFGLQAHVVPLSARIVTLADVYDALTSKRVYKPCKSHEEARDLILAETGRIFDPVIVQAFLAIEDAFRGIAERHRTAAAPEPIEPPWPSAGS